MYHRFATDGAYRRMVATTLTEHLSLARQSCEFVTLKEALAVRASGRTPRRPLVVLTVDDGYRDFYDVAWPLLKQAGVPATVFVSVDFVEKQAWLWPDALEYILLNARPGTIEVALPGLKRQFTLDGVDSRLAAWDAISTALVFETTLRESCIAHLAKQCGVALPPTVTPEYAAMSWEQLRTLAATGVELASHGLSHACMTRLPEAAARREFEASKQIIRQRTDVEVTGFAYPNGGPEDVSDALDTLAADCGYTYTACSFWERRHARRDSLQFGRWSCGENTRFTQNVLSGITMLKRAFWNR